MELIDKLTEYSKHAAPEHTLWLVTDKYGELFRIKKEVNKKMETIYYAYRGFSGYNKEELVASVNVSTNTLDKTGKTLDLNLVYLHKSYTTIQKNGQTFKKVNEAYGTGIASSLVKLMEYISFKRGFKTIRGVRVNLTFHPDHKSDEFYTRNGYTLTTVKEDMPIAKKSNQISDDFLGFESQTKGFIKQIKKSEQQNYENNLIYVQMNGIDINIAPFESQRQMFISQLSEEQTLQKTK